MKSMFVLRFATFAIALALGLTPRANAAVRALGPGDAVPTFTYTLLNGHVLKSKDLAGKPHVLWLVTTWCSSCQAGSSVVADHIDELRQSGVRIVEMRIAQDLGAPGPGLKGFRKAVGKRADSPNWYWGELTDEQSLALDPKGLADIYYLVDAHGRIVAVDGNPAVSWDRIAKFSSTGK